MITAEIKILGKKYLAKGTSVSDAISGLNVVGTPKTLSVLTISQEDKQKSRVLLPKQTFRLFSKSPLSREIAIKQISLLF